MLTQRNNRMALRHDTRTLTYQELAAAIASCQHWLREELKWQRSTVVVGEINDSIATTILMLAVIGAGGVYAPLNTRLPAEDRDKICAQLPPHMRLQQITWSTAGVGDFQWNPQSLCLMVMTSGSTQLPKAVGIGYDALMTSARGSNAFYQVQAGDVWLQPLPLFHIGGIMVVLRMLLAQGSVHFCMTRDALEAAVQDGPWQWISVVPTQLLRLSRQPEMMEPLRAARGIILGGAGCGRDALALWQEQRLPISVSYGATETCAQVCATHPGEAYDPYFAGRALPHREIRVSPAGDIQVRGEFLAYGYYQHHRWYRLPVDAEGWFQLPDHGRINDQGLWVMGRRDLVMITGGENISITALEEELRPILAPLPFIISPAPDEEWGQVPVVVLWSRSRPDFSALAARLQTIPGLRRPRRMEWCELPADDFKPLRYRYTQALLHQQRLDGGLESYALN